MNRKRTNETVLKSFSAKQKFIKPIRKQQPIIFWAQNKKGQARLENRVIMEKIERDKEQELDRE